MMVAFTPLGLEYQLGTDRPCDAPDVWCAFTETLDALLTSTDNSLDRVSPAVPAAKISRLSTTVQSIPDNTGRPILFDTVEYDNDNMVDFARSQYVITPSRLGIYIIDGYMETTLTTNLVNTELVITQGPVQVVPGSSASYNQISTDRVVANNNILTAQRTTAITVWTSNLVSLGNIGFGLFATCGSGTQTVGRAELSLYWVSDITF